MINTEQGQIEIEVAISHMGREVNHGPEGKALFSKNLIWESYKEKTFHNNCLLEVN